MRDDHHRTQALKVGKKLNVLGYQAVLNLDEVIVLIQFSLDVQDLLSDLGRHVVSPAGPDLKDGRFFVLIFHFLILFISLGEFQVESVAVLVDLLALQVFESLKVKHSLFTAPRDTSEI